MALAFIRIISGTLKFLPDISAEEYIERQVFHLTNSRYGPVIKLTGQESHWVANATASRKYNIHQFHSDERSLLRVVGYDMYDKNILHETLDYLI